MANTKLTKFFKSIEMGLNKYSPEILTGIGIAGMITTTILAVKATPKALRLLGEAEYEKGEELTKKEVFETAWKCYIPAAVTCVSSAACLIGASTVHHKRNAVLAAAYKLSESTFADYKEQVINTVGEKKEKGIRDKVNKKRIDENPIGRNEVIITGDGDTTCYDYQSGRYFKSNIEKIRRAVNILNKRMLSEMYVSLNDFYEEIGLKSTQTGAILGWNTDMGLVEVDFSSCLDENGKPCLAIDFDKPPKHNFDKLF